MNSAITIFFSRRKATGIKTLQQVDGLRFTPQLVEKVQNCHRYRCLLCGQDYQRRRRINTHKYRCGKCRGRLITQ